MKRILFLLFLCVAVHSLTAQRGIGTNTPNASSVLDISSTTKGFLPPRMTYAQMTAIVSPTAGLTVYCTDCEPVGVHYYDGSFFLNIQTRATSGALSTLGISSITYTYPTGTTNLTAGTVYTIADGITATVPYTGWGGNTHNPIVFNSTNAWGLKATLDPTSLNAGSGNAIFNITGTIVAGYTSPLLFYTNLGGLSATLTQIFASNRVDTPFSGYSLRKLIDSYNGPAIRVRRSSDNSELDIGFSGPEDLDTAALLNFVGSGDGFVTIWYDQNGSSNAVQTATAMQPSIVTAGVIETVDNGRPSINFGFQDNLTILATTNTLSTSPGITGLFVAEYNSPNDWMIIQSQWNDGVYRTHFSFHNAGTDGVTINGNRTLLGVGAVVPQGQTATIGYAVGPSGSFLSTDGTQTSVTNASLPNASGRLIDIGDDRAGSYFNGKQSEILFYTTVKSSTDYTAIESNQKAYWID